MNKKIILIDQDSVLADFEARFLKKWRAKYPDRPYIPLEERTTLKMADQYSSEYKKEIYELITSPGFILNLEPIEGAIEALKELDELNHLIKICTSPQKKYDYCLNEKYAWVEMHLGFEWTKKIILSKDKTLIRADYLIDDNPTIKGYMLPVWEHILFNQPYNRQIKDKRRMNWTNWKEVLPELLP